MDQIEITRGSRKIIATRNDASSRWNARLYVNGGDTATLIARTFKTESGLRTWAEKILAAGTRTEWHDAFSTADAIIEY